MTEKAEDDIMGAFDIMMGMSEPMLMTGQQQGDGPRTKLNLMSVSETMQRALRVVVEE